jgi:PAS domain S-box-containing protein
VADQQPTVVVVNDDPTQLRLLTALLEPEGLEVRGYLDPEQALRDLEASAPPSLLVLDLHMPGIDGWRFCRLLRSPEYRDFNQVPILVVSHTFAGTDVEAVTAELGANAFLPVPFSPETYRSYVQELLAGRRPHATLSVLVVDDDRGIRELLRRTFAGHGYRVEVAASGVEGRALARRMRPDILVVDHHLPDVPGDALLASLKRPGDAMVGILMTGDPDPELAVTALRKGADAYLRKPFEPTYLLSVAQKARRERSLLRVEEILETRTQELRSSESRYRSLFATIPEAILVLDEAGRIIQSNEVAERRLRRKAPDLFGVRITAFVPPEAVEALDASLAACWAEEAGTFETTLVPVEGTPVLVEVSARVVEFQGGHALLTVSRDITERRRLEEERRRMEERVQHAQKLESLGVLAGGVAHDFNNLLVGILGNASFALMDLTPEHPAWESVRQIEAAARRAADLTAQILTYSGRARAAMRPVDLSWLVREMSPLLEPAVSRKARLEYDLAEGLPPFLGDPGQLRQVLMNLLMNASDALEGNRGVIRVRTAVVELGRDTLSGAALGSDLPAGDYLLLEVVDTGSGMDEETLRRIFDPFFTTRFTGRGLGLAAVLGIVRAHGGGILVRSVPGEGSAFQVIFPESVPSPLSIPPDGERTEDLSWRGAGMVLVVDDEEAVRSVARSTLERAGFTVLTSSDGREGIRLFQEHRNEVVALVVDLAMPEFNGEEVLLAVRTLDPVVRVIVSSGHADDDTLRSLSEKGADAFLRKPWDPEGLRRTLHTLLDDPPAGAAASHPGSPGG